MTCVINIRGCNGAGKSTIVKQFIDRYNTSIIEIDSGSVVSYVKSIDTYILGRYDVTSGGCDRYSSVEEVFSAVVGILKKYHPKAIVYEGAIYSTIFKSNYLLAKCVERYNGKFISVVLHREFSNIVRLIEDRNGGKNFNTANVLGKYEAVITSSKKLELAGVKTYNIDVDAIKKNNMGKILEKIMIKEGAFDGKE